MDYNTMTPKRLAHSIFKASGYKINQLDCQSRIENCCIKYANGDFEIRGLYYKNAPKKQRYKTIKFAACIAIGILIGLLF